jgi:hypothetical protein
MSLSKQKGLLLNKQKIISQLEYFTSEIPVEALEAAIADPQEIVSDLLGFIDYAMKHAEEIQNNKSREYSGHFYALYLLAQFRERSAYAPIVDFFSEVPAETLHEITGDLITEDLHKILPSVCGNDDSLIRGLVENEKAGEYVRAAAVDSFVTMFMAGMKSRDEVVDYFSSLFHGGILREPSMVWNTLVAATLDINTKELYEEIIHAYDENLFETCHVSLREIKKEKDWPIEKSLERLRKIRNHSLINDTIGELKKWNWFERNEDTQDDKKNDNVDDSNIVPVRTGPKIGRNDPCTCGSGKKFKKCCGK